MKMNFWKMLAMLTVTSILITSCDSLSKMVKKHPTDAEYVQTPNPMELHGNNVKVNVTGSYKPSYFNKKAGVLFQPELKYDGGSVLLKSINLKGESVTDLDGTTINNKGGGKFTYADVIPYKPEYKDAQLVVNPTVFPAKNANGKTPASKQEAKDVKKSLDLGEKTLATGINSTPLLFDNSSAEPTLAENNYRIPDNIFKKATLFFVKDMSDLNMKLAANKTDAAKQAFADLEEALNGGMEIASIKIVAWASPEGELKRNDNLAKARANTGEKYIRETYKKVIEAQVKERNKNLKKGEKKITAKDLTKELPLTVEARGEDWDGFMTSLKASNIRDKDKIINVISSNTDPARREQDMRNMIVIYKEIEEQLLPPLRRSEMVIELIVPVKTDEEMASLAIENPKELTVEEILYIAEKTDDNAAKLQIYSNTAETYPDDWRGFNNVAYYQIENKNYDDAGTVLQDANKLSPNNGTVLNNLGVVALEQNNVDDAKKYFNDAKAKGNAQAAANLAPIYIKDGDYATAAAVIADHTGDLNLALAQILSGNLPAAKQTLAAAKDSPKAYYLKAIVAAREDNANEVYANLKNTDVNFKKQAQTDVEFRKYADQAEFMNAIK